MSQKLFARSIFFFNKNYLYALFFLLPLSFCFGQAVVSGFFTLVSLIAIYKFKYVKIHNYLSDSIIFFLILFFLSLILSSLINLEINRTVLNSTLYLRFFLFFMCVYIFFSNLNYDNFEKLQKKYFSFLCVVIFFIIFDGFFQYFNPTREDIFGFKALPGNYQRLTGIFKDEPIIGSFLFHLGFPAIIFLITRINFYLKNFLLNFLLNFLVIFLYLSIILISGERTSFIMALGCFLLILPFFKINKKILFSIIIFFLIFFYFLISTNAYVKTRYQSFLNELIPHNIQISEKKIKRNFFDGQWGAHYLTAFEMFKSQPAFGVGIREFRNQCSDEKYSKIKSISSHIRCSSHPHNIYLEVLSETGLITFSFLIFFLLACFLKSLIFIKNSIKKNFLYDKSEFLVFLSFLLVCLTVFFPVKATGSFYSNFYGSFIWYNMSMLVAYLQVLKKKYN